MDHRDHVDLLRSAIPGPGGIWADLGAGSGAFTLALAELVGPTATLFAVDLDRRALRANERGMRERFPGHRIEYRVADFSLPLGLPPLDGAVMANALHFQVDQPVVVAAVRRALLPGGRLVIVEYNIDRPNFAVPHPVPFTCWKRLAEDAGFGHTELIARRPSRTLREIYSAVSW